MATRSALLLLAVWLSATTAFAQDRNDRRMDIINDTNRAVNSVYATNSTVKDWAKRPAGAGRHPSETKLPVRLQ